MVLPVLFVFLIGFTTGVAVETNTPAVSNFGDKYLAGEKEAGKK
jgi:hypothetical protein